MDLLADYARLVELLAEHGPCLRLPHSRAFGGWPVRAAAPVPLGYWPGVLLLCGGQAGGGSPRFRQKSPARRPTVN